MKSHLWGVGPLRGSLEVQWTQPLALDHLPEEGAHLAMDRSSSIEMRHAPCAPKAHGLGAYLPFWLLPKNSGGDICIYIYIYIHLFGCRGTI